MIEAFHSYGLKTAFTAPWICLCGASRMRRAQRMTVGRKR
jgi:hypothetical protein